MRRSVRARITWVFVGLMSLMLLVIWVVDGWFLESYYTGQKMKVMERAYVEINQAVMERVDAGEEIGDVIAREQLREWEIFSALAKDRQLSPPGKEAFPADESQNRWHSQKQEDPGFDEATRRELEDSLLGTLRGYSEKNNITVILIDSATGKTVVNSGRENDFLAQKLQQYILGQSHERAQRLVERENYVLELTSDRRSGASYLDGWGFFSDNNTLFLMRMPLASIRESVALANRFTTYVGLAVLVLGSIVMYFVTYRVTAPIMELAALSERMSNLDFDAHYEGDAQDEVGVLGNSMNSMSERLKLAIGELQAANAQLQHDIQEKIEVDDMRKEFIANVSHELKTPIALIQGYAEGLTEGMAEDEDSRNYYCEVIMDEANKMNKMVRQLLTLTALEFGNDTPLFQVFDITEMIRNLINSTAILSQQKEAEVSFACEGPVYVRADEFKVEEVVMNYFNNAMNHLGGTCRIRFAVEQTEGVAKVSVYNTGDPIPEEAIPNLWTKFYKVDKARTRTYGGSGIGLSIVKAVMDAHHQQCGVRNAEGGVEFWFTLELAEEPSVPGD